MALDLDVPDLRTDEILARLQLDKWQASGQLVYQLLIFLFSPLRFCKFGCSAIVLLQVLVQAILLIHIDELADQVSEHLLDRSISLVALGHSLRK